MDDYYLMLQNIAVFYRIVIESEEDGKELARIAEGFDREFRPGTDEGVPESVSIPYLYFDLRFGPGGMTVCERFLASPMIGELQDPGLAIIKSMSESYSTFYDVVEIDGDRIIFEELGTGVRWHVRRQNEPEEKETTAGDVWYVRFVGQPDNALIFSAPYIFDAEAREHLREIVGFQEDHFRENLPEAVDGDRLFAECCKAFVPFWADYLTGGDGEALDRLFAQGEPGPET
jgi:hypothetical protein